MQQNRRPTNIDPIFWKPEDVYDFTQTGEEAGVDEDYFIDSENSDVITGDVEGEVVEENNGGYLPSVINFVVVEQIFRVAADGKHLVDVIIEVDDIPGVTGYNVRFSE